MLGFETEEEQPKKKEDIKIIPYHKNSMKIIRGNQYFILEPNRYDINTLMMLIDLKKINKIEERFQSFPDGLDRLTFIKLLKSELPTNPSDPYDDVNMIYGLYKLFCEIDLSGDEIMQWSEFTQFIIDRVEGEDDSNDPNDTKGMKEKEMIRYKRYMISEKVKDYNIHKKDIIGAVYYSKIDKLLVAEYDSKIIKIYNPKTGKCEVNFDIENYFQQKIIEEQKQKNRITKKQKFTVEVVKSLTFSILSMCLSPMNILALCLSSNKICFFSFGLDLKGQCLYEMPTSSLQKRVWYLKEHGVWLSSGRKSENDKFYYLYELDVDFEKNGNKIECLYNKGHWHRSVFFENPTDPNNPNYNKGHQDEILDVIEITKPLLILTACMDGKIRLFNLNDKEYLKVWNTHEGGVRTLAYNPNIESNGLILSTGFEYHINMFATDLSIDDAYKGKLEGHYAPVVCAKFLADSYMCASVDEEAVVKIWDTKQHQCLQSIAPDKKNLVINRLLYIKRYNRFVIYGNKMIFYDPKYRDSEVAKQNKDQNDINYPIQTEFNNYYMRFYIATMKDLRIYSSVNGNLIYVFKKFIEQERFDIDAKIRCFCFDYRHRLVYIGFSNGTVQQFNSGNGSLIKPINEYEVEKDGITTIKTHHTKDVTSMFVFYNNPESADADFILVTTSLDSLVNMYNEKDPEQSTKIRGIRGSHKIGDKVNEILCMDFSRRYNLLATGSVDGLIVLWDFELTKMEDLLYIHTYRPGSYNAVVIKFLDPYPVLAAAYSNGALFLWATKPNIQYRGQCFFRCKNFFKKENGFYPIQISSMLFINHNMNDIPFKVQYDKDFERQIPKDITEDQDLMTNPKYHSPQQTKSYLIIGDTKGWIKCIDLVPILKKFDIQIMDESTIQSSFNIMKKEEIHAESSLMYNLQKEKDFICNFSSLYPSLMRYEEHIHNDELIHISMIEEPFSLITTGKDQRIKIWNMNFEIIGEIYTGINAQIPPIAEWKFNVDWDKLKKKEIEELLDIVKEVDGDLSFLTPARKDDLVYNPNLQNEDEKNVNTVNSQVFKTGLLIKKKRFKKIETKKENARKYDDDNRINESYEGRFIQEMKKKIDEMFVKHGEEVGMNEMSRNVIDNVAANKDIMELFQPPQQTHKKTNSSTKLLPKLSSSNIKIKEAQDERKELFSEKFIKKSDDNIKDTLILPLINHEFKSNENVKFKQGETEKILAFEYYNNSYKECCRIKQSFEPIASLRANYRLMWNFVDGYTKKKKGKHGHSKKKK